MNWRIRLAIALVLFVPGTVAASEPSSGIAMEILVDGRPLPLYAAYGTRYIEALKGHEYEIRLRNPWPVRVAVALSVDGLNTIDARHTTAGQARKWVIEPYGTITIGGWQTSMTEARRFHFTSERRSYAQWLGKADDIGIISAAFFKERVRAPLIEVPFGSTRDESSAKAAPSAGAPAPRAEARARASESGVGGRADDYAATGIGRRTDHPVSEVYLDLEDRPALSIDVRYEYRAQLVRLGILPDGAGEGDPLDRRQHSRGFAPGFCPDPGRSPR